MLNRNVGDVLSEILFDDGHPFDKVDLAVFLMLVGVFTIYREIRYSNKEET